MGMFDRISFQDANPVLSGVNSVQELMRQALLNQNQRVANQYQPQNLAEALKQAQLQNGLSGVQLQYAPQVAQAGLNNTNAQTGLMGAQAGEARARIPEIQAQANLANQQAQYFPYLTAANFDPITKMVAGRQFVNSLLGGQGLRSNDGGMTVQPTGQQQPISQGGMSIIPGGLGNMQRLPGGLSPQQGGSMLNALNSVAPGQNSAQPQSAPQNNQLTGDAYNNLYDIQMKNLMATLGKDPAFGSQRSGAGGTYTDPMTGKQYTTDTQKNTTQDQIALGAFDRVKPLINDVSKGLAPFQTLGSQAGLKSSQFMNWALGQDNPSPALYAKGQASLELIAESLLKSFNLNVTNESLHSMREAVRPRSGESTPQYENRLQDLTSQLAENASQSAGRLKSGVQIDNYTNPAVQNTSPPQQASSQMVKVQTPDGSYWNISPDKLGEAVKRGAKRVQ